MIFSGILPEEHTNFIVSTNQLMTKSFELDIEDWLTILYL